MMATGQLDASRLPLTRALIETLVDDGPFVPDWTAFHK
jgi:hypothetical protein